MGGFLLSGGERNAPGEHPGTMHGSSPCPLTTTSMAHTPRTKGEKWKKTSVLSGQRSTSIRCQRINSSGSPRRSRSTSSRWLRKGNTSSTFSVSPRMSNGCSTPSRPGTELYVSTGTSRWLKPGTTRQSRLMWRTRCMHLACKRCASFFYLI
jgi:hypothetical protein